MIGKTRLEDSYTSVVVCRPRDREVVGSIPGCVATWFPYWLSWSEHFVAAPSNSRLISVETRMIIIIPKALWAMEKRYVNDDDEYLLLTLSMC
jgi:hypothetical protein